MFMCKENNTKPYSCQYEKVFAATNTLAYAVRMSKLRENLHSEMDKKGWNAYDMENFSGVPQPTTQRFLSGKQNEPRSTTVLKWALALGLSEAELRGLVNRTPTLPAPGNAEPAPAPSAISQRIPLLTWIRAGDFCESGQYTAEDAEDWLPEPPWKCGNRCFALTVRGDSMATPEGYQEGEIVYIDPDVNATPGRDVLAYYDGKATLKRLKEDEHGRYLLQLNGNIIIRPQGDWHVCGVVIFSGRKR